MSAYFADRAEAGRLLARRLGEYATRPDVVVLALPRGGVAVASEIAQVLHAPLDVLLVRKLGVPGHEELAFGAIASGGVRILDPDIVEAFALSPEVLDRVIAKEMAEYTRGRPVGEISGLIADEMLRLGAPPGSVVRAPSELEAVHQALAWSEPGDLLLLTIHGQRSDVLALLDRLREDGWTPGHSTR